MAYLKISEMNKSTEISDEAIFPFVENSANKATTYKTIKDDILADVEGTTDYTQLTNKPSINSIELTGALTSDSLGLVDSADLDNYYTKTTTDTLLASKQDALTAGDNIKIENNVISAIDSTDLSDYYTKEEIDSSITRINNNVTTNTESISDLDAQVSTNTSNINTNSSNISTLQENEKNYSLITETGSTIDLSVDTSTYVMTLSLKDKNDNILSTGTIDLPLETMVVNASYDSTNKTIILTLQNGTEVSFSVADLVSGLVSETDFNTTLQDYVTFTDIASTTKTGVIKLGSGMQKDTDGATMCNVLTYDTYSTSGDAYFISKGTLENVITGKDLTTKSYVDTLVGDIDTLLDTINGEEIS